MAKLSPSEFADKYLSLPVYIYPPESDKLDNSALAAPGWQTVECSNYRLSDSPVREGLWHDIKAHMPAMVDFRIRTIDDVIISDTMSRDALWQYFRHPFVGKGSPEQAQLAIQLVYRFHKAKTTLEDFLKKNFIGLDCNGFIGNYYQRVVKEGIAWDTQDIYAKYGPNSSMGDLMAVPETTGGVIKDLSELDRSKAYVLVMADKGTGAVVEPSKGKAAKDDQPAVKASFGHIMLTQPNTLRPGSDKSFVNVSVSEATAAGAGKLRKDVDYKIYNRRVIGRNVIFTVDRGSTSDTLDVQIAPLP